MFECIAEHMIPFKNELAVIVSRNVSGEVKTYPVVEMEFHPEANQVEYVICPARIDESVAQKLKKLPLKFLMQSSMLDFSRLKCFKLKMTTF